MTWVLRPAGCYQCVWEFSVRRIKETGYGRSFSLMCDANNSPSRLILSNTAAKNLWSRMCAKCYILYRKKMGQICKILTEDEISGLCFSCSIRYNWIIPYQIQNDILKMLRDFQSFLLHNEMERWLPLLLNSKGYECVCHMIAHTHIHTHTQETSHTHVCDHVIAN